MSNPADAGKEFRIRKSITIDVVKRADVDGEFYGENLYPEDAFGYLDVHQLRQAGFTVDEVVPPPPPVPDGTLRRFVDSGNVVVKKEGVWYYVTSRADQDAIGTSEIGGHNSFTDESLFDAFEWVQI